MALQVRVKSKFPSRVVGSGGVSVTKSGGVYTIASDLTSYPNLDAINDLAMAANKGIYFTDTDTAAPFDITAAARALLDDASASDMRTTLGLAIGSDVQAFDADLSAIAALAKDDGNIIVGNGTAWVAESGATARTSLGLAIGTDVQAYTASLSELAGLAKTAGNIIIGGGSSWSATSAPAYVASLGYVSPSGTFTLTNKTIDYNSNTITNLPAATAVTGQCLFRKNGAALELIPYNGNKLVINGTQVTIPDSGVSYTATSASLSINTNYHFYAYLNGSSSLTLEPATTSGSIQSGTGYKIKSGDATRTYVGFMRTGASGEAVDETARRFVRSWFNSPPVYAAGTTMGGAGISATAAFTEVTATARVQTLLFSGDVISFCHTGTSVTGAAGQTSYLAVGTSTTASLGLSNGQYTAVGNVAYYINATGGYVASSDGYEYFSPGGLVTGGSATYQGALCIKIAGR